MRSTLEKAHRFSYSVVLVLLSLVVLWACLPGPKTVNTNPAVKAEQERVAYDARVESHAREMLEQGREIFRYDTFGSEDFWGGQLRLHEAILGEKQGGVGPGITPKKALELGLKVDVGKLPKILVSALRESAVSLENPETTVALLRADSVVGIKGIFKDDKLVSVGLECAFCHSTVDDSFAKGIGSRLDGWPNRDLNVGAIAALSPDLKPMAELL